MRCEAAEARGLAANTGGVLTGALSQINKVEIHSLHCVPIAGDSYSERCPRTRQSQSHSRRTPLGDRAKSGETPTATDPYWRPSAYGPGHCPFCGGGHQRGVLREHARLVARRLWLPLLQPRGYRLGG